VKQETVSGSGISWAICKSAPCSRQTTTPAPYHSVFYRPDALPAAQPTCQSTEGSVNTKMQQYQKDKREKEIKIGYWKVISATGSRSF